MSAPADAVSQLTWRMRMGTAGGVTLKTFYGLAHTAESALGIDAHLATTGCHLLLDLDFLLLPQLHLMTLHHQHASCNGRLLAQPTGHDPDTADAGRQCKLLHREKNLCKIVSISLVTFLEIHYLHLQKYIKTYLI